MGEDGFLPWLCFEVLEEPLLRPAEPLILRDSIFTELPSLIVDKSYQSLHEYLRASSSRLYKSRTPQCAQNKSSKLTYLRTLSDSGFTRAEAPPSLIDGQRAIGNYFLVFDAVPLEARKGVL